MIILTRKKEGGGTKNENQGRNDKKSDHSGQ